MTPNYPHHKTGLVWTAAFVLALGGIITYFIWFNHQQDLEWRTHLALAALLSILLAGVFLISASAHWWIHR